MTDAAVPVLVLGLVAWRLWQLVGNDTITDPLRRRLPGGVQYWLGCPYCSGTWIAGGVTLAADLTVGVAAPVFVAVAAAAVVVVVEAALSPPEGS